MRHITHLTVDWSCSIQTNKAKYRSHKASHARDGVDLSSEQISPGDSESGNQSEALIATNPYRPPIGDMTPKDLPFVVEGSKELPPERGSLYCVALCGKRLKTHRKRP